MNAMVTTEDVIELVGYVCNRCFLGKVTADRRTPCEFCEDWSDEQASAVLRAVRVRMVNVRDTMVLAFTKDSPDA